MGRGAGSRAHTSAPLPVDPVINGAYGLAPRVSPFASPPPVALAKLAAAQASMARITRIELPAPHGVLPRCLLDRFVAGDMNGQRPEDITGTMGSLEGPASSTHVPAAGIDMAIVPFCSDDAWCA